MLWIMVGMIVFLIRKFRIYAVVYSKRYVSKFRIVTTFYLGYAYFYLSICGRKELSVSCYLVLSSGRSTSLTIAKGNLSFGEL